MLQIIPILSLQLCTNCKYFVKDKCSLFPLNDIGDQFMDCTTSRKFYYMCGEKGRYYQPLNNEPKLYEIPDNYDFEKYIQLL